MMTSWDERIEWLYEPHKLYKKKPKRKRRNR